MSTAQVRITPAADQDITRSFHYIAADNLDAAMRLVTAVETDYQRLADMPGMGAKRDEFKRRFPGLRSWPVSGFRNYLIFYQVVENGIEGVRVLHEAQNLIAFFDE